MKNKNTSDQDIKITNEVMPKQKAEKARKFPKFGVLDAVIILLVVVICAGVYFRYSFFDMLNSSKNLKECYVTFKTDKITTAVSRELEKDDFVYFKSDGSDFGTITTKSEAITIAIQEQPATTTVFKDGKTYADVQYPSGMEDSLISGTGTIKCECSIAENGSFLLNGSSYIAPGQTYTVCTERVTFKITITAIELVPET
jgi:hypothetical protein